MKLTGAEDENELMGLTSQLKDQHVKYGQNSK